jgi:F-type H+-transporting ATPase subunit beta
MPVQDTGTTRQMPVGRHLLGRMLNVFGEAIDGKNAIEAQEYCPIHRPLLPLADRTTGTETFETGIKDIDLLAPLERGGKTGMFGGAWVGKTVVINEMNTTWQNARKVSACSVVLAIACAKQRKNIVKYRTRESSIKPS